MFPLLLLCKLLELLDYSFLSYKEGSAERTELLQIRNITDKTTKALSFIKWVISKYQCNDFIVNSDFIVPLNSQKAGYPLNAPNVTNFDGSTHSDPYFNSVKKNVAVGTRIFELLHTPINSSSFNTIPATPTSRFTRDTNYYTMPTGIKENGFEILFPADSIGMSAGENLNITIRILDTVNLSYVSIRSEDNYITIPSDNFSNQFNRKN